MAVEEESRARDARAAVEALQDQRRQAADEARILAEREQQAEQEQRNRENRAARDRELAEEAERTRIREAAAAAAAQQLAEEERAAEEQRRRARDAEAEAQRERAAAAAEAARRLAEEKRAADEQRQRAREADDEAERQHLAEVDEMLRLLVPEAEGEEEAGAAPPSPAAALPHATIPHDELVGERTAATRIGVGRFGEVFRAQRRRAGPVAVKIVPPLMDYRVEFETHLRLSMTMEGVCRMHGLCEEHPIFGTCFVMKLYERSLDDEIAADGAMELSRAIGVASTIAATMAELHDLHQILVADLKPANVLIDERGRPVISDFGVSQQIGTAMLSHGISSARGGTVHYMSPEQLGAEDEDGNDIRVLLQSDVWSFGCTLLHMLTGTMPWTDSRTGAPLSEKKVMTKVALRMRAPPLAGLPAATPDALRALLSECLLPLAGDRPRFGGDEGLAARLREMNDAEAQVREEERAASDYTAGGDEALCVVCLDAERTHAFLPCGHRCVCEGCLGLSHCPICRAVATGTLRVYI